MSRKTKRTMEVSRKMIDVLNIIQEMQKEKEDKGITPPYVIDADLFNRVNQEVKETLNELYKEKKIGINQTINNKAIYIK